MARSYLFGLTGNGLQSAMLWTVIMPAYILFGFNQAVAGPLLNLPSWIATFPQIDTSTTVGATRNENSRVQGTVVAMYTVGCLFGALACIFVGDKLGRIKTIQLGSVVSIIGAILMSSSFSLAQLIVGRLSECSKASHRGAAVLLESFFISLGLAISAWINLGMSFTTGEVSWRFPLALTALWAIMVLVAIPWMPESPRWLLKVGRVQEARRVLSALNGVPEDHSSVTLMTNEIMESVKAMGSGRFIDCFKNGELRLLNRTCLGCAGQMFQQLTGINALAFYVTTIFQEYLGLSGTDARILGASVFTFQAACSPIGVLTVDRFGRRKLMMISAAGMGTCMAIVAGTSSQASNKTAVGVAGAFIFLFSLFFPVGFLGLTFLYASEISPLHVRVPITSMSTATAWAFNFMVAEVTPVGFATIGWRYYIVWACMNFLLILPSVYFFFPETSGRQLEEVDQIFRASSNAFSPVKAARNLPRQHDLGGPEKSEIKTGAEAIENSGH